MITPGDCPAKIAGKRGGPLKISHLPSEASILSESSPPRLLTTGDEIGVGIPTSELFYFE